MPIAGFAYPSHDARDACIAAIDRDLLEEPTFESKANECRDIGAPILFICCRKELQWWNLKSNGVVREDTIPAAKVSSFFNKHKKDFLPESIYRAKNLSRVHSEYQLKFVDQGLMPILEHEMGNRLADLIKNTLRILDEKLGIPQINIQLNRWMFRCAFWLLGAKILQDKKVKNFIKLDLEDVPAVLERVNRHYGAKDGLAFRTEREQRALEAASSEIKQFSSLNNLTIESLAHVYETTLIDKETRKAWGIHATPSYLVDYIVLQLFDWIKDIPQENRYVLEPTCGHAPFLTSALRLLRGIYEGDRADLHKYLNFHLVGVEQDLFAREIARLSLTLADVPNPNGWELKECDVFEGDVLSKLAKKSTILLCNPPFEGFKGEKAKYTQKGVHLEYDNKTAEVLWRTLPYMPVGSVFGVVVPRGFLENENTTSLRKLLVKEFELKEICVLPDKVFEFGDLESSVILGRRRVSKKISNTVKFVRVREKDISKFQYNYKAPTEIVQQSCFLSTDRFNLYVPELGAVWDYCQSFNRLEMVVDVRKTGKGLEYKSEKNLLPNIKTKSKHRFKGAVQGYDKAGGKSKLTGTPELTWMNVDDKTLRRVGQGKATGKPRIILNSAPVGRGPWRLEVQIDDRGRAITSSFIAVQPTLAGWSFEALWAVLNSPLANAYIYCHANKWLIGVKRILKLPIPAVGNKELCYLQNLVQDYFSLDASQGKILQPEVDSNEAEQRMLAIDAEVMRLYDLPPKLERQILDLFESWERKGVDFKFDRYYPEGFESWIPLYEYLSEEYQRSTPSFVNEWVEKNRSPEVIRALKAAVEAFEE